MKINIKKISELSGFSIATVSNALNKKKGVNAQTARKIWEIAEQYGYVLENKIDTILLAAYRDSGKVLSNSPFFATLLESVENEGRRNGFETRVFNIYRQSDNFVEEFDQIINDSSTAVIMVGTEMDREAASKLLAAKAPMVLLDSSFGNLPLNAVLMNNEDSIKEAVDYLVSLGHKEIGYLRSNVRTQNFDARFAGFRLAMAENGLDIKEEFIREMPVSIAEAQEDFANWLSASPKLPTAFLADMDLIALGAMQALKANGIKVPERVSLIGFDDISFSEVMEPGLTTIRVFTKELGQAAVRRLIDLINNPTQAKSCIRIYNELVIRGSTAAPMGE